MGLPSRIADVQKRSELAAIFAEPHHYTSCYQQENNQQEGDGITARCIEESASRIDARALICVPTAEQMPINSPRGTIPKIPGSTPTVAEIRIP